jgi:hypothetical protein
MPVVIGSTPVRCECGDVTGTLEERHVDNTTFGSVIYHVYDLVGKFYINVQSKPFCFVCKSEVTRRFF